jgi:hypothetical protein
VYDFVYGGVIVVTWFHEKLAQVMESYMGYSLTITQGTRPIEEEEEEE